MHPVTGVLHVRLLKSDDTIEYTRTDAFIEKACEFLKEHREEVRTEDNGIIGWIEDCFIENFKKYLEEQV